MIYNELYNKIDMEKRKQDYIYLLCSFIEIPSTRYPKMSTRKQSFSILCDNNTLDDTTDFEPISSSNPLSPLRMSHSTYPKGIPRSPPIAYQIASMSSTTPTLVSIEGNIGSGKSTLLHKVKYNPLVQSIQTHLMRPIVFVNEPVDEWETIRDTKSTILERFYQDPHQYAFSFQIMAYATRFRAIQHAMKKYPNAILLTERCLETDKHIFARLLHEMGHISTIDYQIYQTCYDAFSSLPTHTHIYVNTHPRVCYARVQKRLRKGEDGITLDYLQECGRCHDEWLIKKENVHELDGNAEFASNPDISTSMIKSILYALNPTIERSYIDELYSMGCSTSDTISSISSSAIRSMTLNGC